MADEQTVAQPTQASGKKGRLMSLVIIGFLMLAEGVGVFLLAKAISPNSAAPALGAGAGGGGGAMGDSNVEEVAEVELVECRPSNKMTGRLVSFHIRVSALVASADLERAQALARAKRARLEDGVNAVIRSADPKHLNEPRLETIKRRLRYEFDRIFGDDKLIQDVLIPQMLQSGPGV